MEKIHQYREKNAHDIQVQDMVVRMWSATGPRNRLEIGKMLEPLARTGFVYPYMALMPDWHPGEDVVVGSVVPTRVMLLPQVIGGDIGCGMCAVRLPFLSKVLRDRFGEVAARLREGIPVGTSHNAVITDRVERNPIWERELRAPIFNRTFRKLMRQFGSLGGGNHFLEILKDHEDRIWVMLHSGSRYLGVEVRDYYVAEGASQAGVDPKRYARIPYIPADSALGADYLADVEFVRTFARESRKEMMLRALDAISGVAGGLDIVPLMIDAIEISHNYVALEEHFGEPLYVHRKGAIHLPEGAKGLVPGSMGTASYVVEGRGNRFGFCSCAHGGGRSMSRSDASRLITPKAFRQSMEGIICEHDGMLLDEAPEAYKDIRMVMRGQSDLVKAVWELHPVISIKGR